MTEKLLKEAVQLCLDNVEQYIKDAQLLVENGSHGHAFALAVLSEEELSKAFIYYMCSEELLPNDLVKRVGRTRGSHMRKQGIALTLILVSKVSEIMQSIVKSSLEQAGENTEKRKQIAYKKLKEIMDNMKKHKDIFDFLEQDPTFQEDKEKGLYVDVNIEQGILTSPKSLEKDKAEKQLAQIKKIFELTKPLLKLTFPSSAKEYLKKLVTESGFIEAM